jgi:DNA-binding HxlR family transcriptional regulator
MGTAARSLLILRDALFRGMTRFSELQRRLEVAPKVLTVSATGPVTCIGIA